MKKVCIPFVRFGVLLGFTLLIGTVSAQDQCKVVGWATQNGNVSGGGNASPVEAANYDDLKSALTSSTVKVVHVRGSITIPPGGRITIQDISGKSIFGLPGSKIVSTDMTKDGSGILYIKRCTNFIMRNLVLEGPGAYDTDGYDNLCIDNCQNFWVDHCEFHDGMDGNFDIKNMSDFISVTWSTFSYEKAPKADGSGGSSDHRYSNLIGSSDGATDDATHLNVTFNYCWWGAGCRERMPRMRFGKLHMVNNLFTSSVANNCIRAGFKADILAVGNYFDNQKLPIDEYKDDYTAIKAYNNFGASDMTKKSAFSPPYTLAVAAPTTIVTPIKSCAGAKLTAPNGCSSCGGPTNEPPQVAITTPANNTSFEAPAPVTLSASATDEDGTITQVVFFSDTALLGSDNSAPYTYSWANAPAGTYTITAVATDNGGASSTSTPVTIVVINPNIPSLLTTANTLQTVELGKAINPIVFTWGGTATDVSITTLPEGLTASKNSGSKTVTVSGTPVKDGTFSVSTMGGTPEVKRATSVIIKLPSVTLADWYTFQESTPSLQFLSFSDGTIETDYFDQTKPDNGVAYTAGALRLNKGVGTMKLTLRSLEILKIRCYATGGRSLKVTYGPTGNEHTWTSSAEYGNGAHEVALTTTIPELVSALPITVIIINNRTDGGSLNIQDLYVSGTETTTTAVRSMSAATQPQLSSLRAVAAGNTLFLHRNSWSSKSAKQQIFIVNLQGKQVATLDFSQTIDISRLEKGLYFLMIGSRCSTFMKR